MGIGVLRWGGCVFGGVGGWRVSEFWTSSIVYTIR